MKQRAGWDVFADFLDAKVIYRIGAVILLCGGSSFVPRAAHADPMTFQLVSVDDSTRCGRYCPAVIAAEGEITDQTPEQFLEFVQENVNRASLHAVVFLDSPGGKVEASMELGREFRRLGTAAIVARVDPNSRGGMSSFVGARCLSACVYALIGAKKRVIPPESLVGIHRMFAYVDSVDARGDAERYRLYDNGSMRAALSHYTGMMGVSPALITRAEHISSDQIHILTRREIARYRLGSSRF
ncbi:MAG: hypothetical protein ACLQL2_07500 [Methylovirgula sp.]